MKRRKKSSGAMNFWPGYVDALTNVVLNLLFMVAMFGITIAVFNKTPGMGGEGQEPLMSTAKDQGAVTPQPLAPLALQGMPGQRLGPDGNSPSAAGLGASATGATATAPSVSNGPDASTVGIVVADAFERRGGPDVTIVRRPATGGGMMLSFDIVKGSDPVASLNKPSVASALQKTLGGSTQKISLWTSVATVDPIERRAAYLSLITLRNQLINIGISPSSISTRVHEGSAGTVSGQRLYLVTTP